MKFYVYLHCKPNGDPFYVGKGSGKRARQLRTGRNAAHRIVVNIREDYENPETSWLDLSRRYGISRSQVGRIVKRESWNAVS